MSSDESNDSFGGKIKNPNNKQKKYETYIKKLKEALDDKETQLNESKKMLVEDEEIKKLLKDKVETLSKRLEEFQAGFNDNLNDEEIDKLLGRDDAAVDIFSNEEMVDTNPMKENPNEDDPSDFRNMEFLYGGNAMMNDYQTRVYLLKKKTCWGRFKIFVEDVVDFFVPFKEDIEYISKKYDRNVSAVFRILRFIFILQCLISLSQLYLLIKQIVDYANDFSTNNRQIESISAVINVSSADELDANQYLFLCYNYLPCVIFFSRFSSNMRLTFSVTFIFTLLLTFIIITHKWVWSKRVDVLNDLFFNEEKQFSKYFFTMWDWSSQTLVDSELNKHKIKNLLTIGVKEYFIKKEILKREFSETMVLYLRRAAGIFLSLIVLLIGGILVFSFYILQGYLNAKLDGVSGNSFLKFIALISPGIGISIINAFLPILFDLIIQIEKWDFNSSLINQLIWRNFAFKMFTHAIVYFIVIYFGILEKSASTIFGTSVTFDFEMKPACPSSAYIYVSTDPKVSGSGVNFPAELIHFSKYANCPEDHIAMTLLINLILDWIIRKISPIVIYFVRKLFFQSYKKKKTFKSNYDLIQKASHLLVFSIQCYLIFFFFPFIAVISPFLLLADFKYEVFSIKNLFLKPEKNSLVDESEFFLISMYNGTIICLLFVLILYFKLAVPHINFFNCFNSGGNLTSSYSGRGCGPYPDSENYESVILDFVNSSSFWTKLYTFLDSPVSLFAVIMILCSIIAYKYHHSEALNFYIEEKRKENDANNNYSNELISKLRSQLKFFRGSYKKQEENLNNKKTLVKKKLL